MMSTMGDCSSDSLEMGQWGESLGKEKASPLWGSGETDICPDQTSQGKHGPSTCAMSRRPILVLGPRLRVGN